MSPFIMFIAFFVIFFFVFYLPNKKKETRKIELNTNNEKILIKSKCKSKKANIIFSAVGGGIAIIAALFIQIQITQGRMREEGWMLIALFLLLGALDIFSAYHAYLRNFIEVTVTDKRVCVLNTKTNTQKELPFDQISSAVKENNIVRISSSSGNITINFCPDIDAVYNVISNQLKVVQTKHVIVDNTVATAQSTQSPEPKDNNVEKLREYKKLLDEGIITPEEFEIKKKQLLDL